MTEPKTFTRAELHAAPDRVYREAKEHGSAIVLDTDGEPMMTVSVPQVRVVRPEEWCEWVAEHNARAEKAEENDASPRRDPADTLSHARSLRPTLLLDARATPRPRARTHAAPAPARRHLDLRRAREVGPHARSCGADRVRACSLAHAADNRARRLGIDAVLIILDAPTALTYSTVMMTTTLRPATETTKEVRVTHSCRACKRFVSELALVCVRFYTGAYGRRERSERFVDADGTSRGDIRRVCACGRDMGYTQIKGKKTNQPCGARCLASKGPTCECSCGGKNHGAGHVE